MGRAMYGYARVSHGDQNEARQLIALAGLGVPRERTFVDKQSGKDFDRPAYQAMLGALQPGDVLYVLSIDRLGRNYTEILEQWRALTHRRGVDIVVIDMPLLDTRRGKDLLGTLIGDLVLSLLSYSAQSERESIKRRQAEGISAAKQRGIRFGRPSKPLPADFSALVSQWERGALPLPALLAHCGISESTFYRRLRVLRAGRKKLY